jgi:hypothetical protein
MIQRHLRHQEKVLSICKCESQAILNYALQAIPVLQTPNFPETRDFRRLRYQFHYGILTPESDQVCGPKTDSEFQTLLPPMHTLETEHYLHFQSDSLLQPV